MTRLADIANQKFEGVGGPFVIAELSGNHQQSYDLAIAMVEAAAAAGVDAIKLQTYTADSMTLDLDQAEFVISEKDSLWKGESLHSLYTKAATPYSWHEGIFKRAKELGLLAFSSPFDEAAVDFLEQLAVPCYKIASFENNDFALIEKAASTGKPVIISTGMASISEIEDMVAVVKKFGRAPPILLKCTSAYPAPNSDTNLSTLSDMSERFGCAIGLSDHTLGSDVAVAATALGATVIEKHFVLDRDEGGVDAAFSLEPSEMAELVNRCRRVREAVGEVNYGETASDVSAKRYRRSLYITETVREGEVVSAKHLRSIRPGLGLAPKYLDRIIGKIAKQDIPKGTAVSWDLFSD